MSSRIWARQKWRSSVYANWAPHCNHPIYKIDIDGGSRHQKGWIQAFRFDAGDHGGEPPAGFGLVFVAVFRRPSDFGFGSQQESAAVSQQ